MPGIDGQLELFTEIPVGEEKVVIFVKVLCVEDKSWQSQVINFCKRVFAKYKIIWQIHIYFSELLVITVPDN